MKKKKAATKFLLSASIPRRRNYKTRNEFNYLFLTKVQSKKENRVGYVSRLI
jgi:hypothetical protein